MVSVREQYEQHGVENYYQQLGDTYQNPHSEDVFACLFQLKDLLPHGFDELHNTLDLCCGNGLVSSFLAHYQTDNVEGCDPFLWQNYEEQTNNKAYRYDFVQIAKGGLGWSYSNIICSYALHLCEHSLLHDVLYSLAFSSPRLIVISPTSKPEIKNWFELEHEIRYGKSQMRTYRSLLKPLDN